MPGAEHFSASLAGERKTAVRYPLWMWPHLLSLDAPAVAVVWQLLLAKTAGAWSTTPRPIILGLSVWLIYSADRLLDSRRPVRIDHAPRHVFALQFRKPLRIAWILALILDAVLVAQILSAAEVILGVALLSIVAAYLMRTHLGAFRRRRWPKELTVGLIFAAGTWLPVLLASRFALSVVIAGVLPFGFLCWWNCTAIEAWEARQEGHPRQWHATTRWLALRLPATAVLFAMLSGSVFVYTGHPVALAECCSALLFWWLSKMEGVWKRDLLRVLVDACLLTPLAVLPFL